MKKIIIIGGGFLGSCAARLLENDFEVTLIDNKDYFEFTPGILRTIVEPEYAKKMEVKHQAYLKKTRFIYGDATSITEKNVYLGKKKIPFDYLIIATGSTYSTPIKEADIILTTRAKELQKYYDKLEKAQHALIIGGGFVGVELAAEIIEHYPNKKVTIVHAKEKLLERSTQKAQVYAEQFLRKKGVELILNERIIKKTCMSTGRVIPASICFLCTGITPNTSFLDKTWLNERKQVKVNEHLQVEGYQHIFAGGDASSVLEEKTAQNAEQHAKTIAKNIKAIETRNQLEKYIPTSRIMVISLGKKHGILTYKNFTITGKIPGLLKNIIEWFEMKKRRQA